jgi:hypothetical protein
MGAGNCTELPINFRYTEGSKILPTFPAWDTPKILQIINFRQAHFLVLVSFWQKNFNNEHQHFFYPNGTWEKCSKPGCPKIK